MGEKGGRASKPSSRKTGEREGNGEKKPIPLKKFERRVGQESKSLENGV